VEKPASHGGEHSTEDCVSQCNGITVDSTDQDLCLYHRGDRKARVDDDEGTEDTTTGGCIIVDGTEDHWIIVDGTEDHCQQQRRKGGSLLVNGERTYRTEYHNDCKGEIAEDHYQLSTGSTITKGHRFPCYLSQMEFMS
jgi:hypothetical protein